jgi:hypothetical protein
MPAGNQKRTRSQRVAALELPPGAIDRFFESLRQADVLWRIALCLAVALGMWAILGGWSTPMPYRLDDVPARDIDTRVEFRKPDPEKTEEARRKAVREIRYVYVQDAAPLVQLRAALKNVAAEIAAAPTLAALRPGVWHDFYPPPAAGIEPANKADQERDYAQLHAAVDSKDKLIAFEKGIDRAFSDLDQKGILEKLEQLPDEGNQTEIEIHPLGVSAFPAVVPVADVRSGEATAHLHNRLKTELSSPDVAQRVFYWLKPNLAKLTPTLKKDAEATEKNGKVARDSVKDMFTTYAVVQPGQPHEPLARAGVPIDGKTLHLLRLEHQAELAQMATTDKLWRGIAGLGMFAALYALCGFYVFNRSRVILLSLRRLAMLQGLALITVALCAMCALSTGDAWRAELIPLLLFGMTVVIAYHQELALLLSAAMALVVVIGLGQSLADYVTLLSASATAIFLMGRIRSRSKLIYVGLCSGAVAMLTSIGVHVLEGEPAGSLLLEQSGQTGLWAVAAGFLMTGLLPFIEKLFGVLTDISLLEIGDVAHPLLQELVRRAPGTYNHSINVASLAEAAAESIGAHALLVRVGAYFHDIGKMLKPMYFVENQGLDSNRHETLLPAMSTLIIIAHIKDGADLARQHHLAQPIIDFILQHHGTTLVEYFYRRANKQSAADPHGSEVDESSYRYPGPKPLTKEAAVLMVADAVESASRALTEPTPARIESLVREISLKRLLDGQFDESGLTLQELQTIEESLVKSLTAVYHGRVKYPDQQTA